MEIPILTKFIEGLKIFWSSKRLRWLTLIFIIGAVLTTILGRLGEWILQQNPGNIPLSTLLTFIVAIGGGIWPVFFLITAFLSLIGLQRYIANEESYKRSFVVFIPWLAVSTAILFLMVIFTLPLLTILFFFIAFLGWIGFQAYFSTRTSLQYARMAKTTDVSKWKQVLVYLSYFFCYAVILGVFLYVTIVQGLFVSNIAQWALILIGTLLAAGFNFINGIIMTSQRNKPTLINIALIGLFISLYSSYFIYSGAQATGTFLVDLIISIFFLLYTMSSVGRTLAKRADLDTRFKISRELAATFTYFLASGYYFASAFFSIQAPGLPNIDNIIKLLIFPFIALIMEIWYLWRGKDEKPEEVEPEEEEVKPVPEELEEAEPVTQEEGEDIPEEEELDTEEYPSEEPIDSNEDYDDEEYSE